MYTNPSSSALLISLAWLMYFVLHSILASNNTKNKFNNRFPGLSSCYRLGYNIIAMVGLIPILILLTVFQGPLIIEWPEAFAWLKNLLIVSAVSGFVWSLRYYNLSEFSGLNQCRNKNISKNQFIISALHRYVRHPWYFFALIIIWSRNLDMMQLISTIMMSAYFLIGSKLEEDKLRQEHGEVYSAYKSKVPALIPLPWKSITKEEAEELMKQDRTD